MSVTYSTVESSAVAVCVGNDSSEEGEVGLDISIDTSGVLLEVAAGMKKVNVRKTRASRKRVTNR